MTNCLKEQQQLVCKIMGLAVNTFEQTNCSGIAPRAMLGSFSLWILVPPEVVCFWRLSFPEIHFVCSIERGKITWVLGKALDRMSVIPVYHRCVVWPYFLPFSLREMG